MASVCPRAPPAPWPAPDLPKSLPSFTGSLMQKLASDHGVGRPSSRPSTARTSSAADASSESPTGRDSLSEALDRIAALELTVYAQQMMLNQIVPLQQEVLQFIAAMTEPEMCESPGEVQLEADQATSEKASVFPAWRSRRSSEPGGAGWCTDFPSRSIQEQAEMEIAASIRKQRSDFEFARMKPARKPVRPVIESPLKSFTPGRPGAESSAKEEGALDRLVLRQADDSTGPSTPRTRTSAATSKGQLTPGEKSPSSSTAAGAVDEGALQKADADIDAVPEDGAPTFRHVHGDGGSTVGSSSDIRCLPRHIVHEGPPGSPAHILNDWTLPRVRDYRLDDAIITPEGPMRTISLSDSEGSSQHADEDVLVASGIGTYQSLRPSSPHASNVAAVKGIVRRSL
eukprot:TRINITY_DN7920_c0_g1_i2.p1 TRINITY_DN7920_c0_g1~~TRINITY_DN7920_c0_g1_i2.p1  ORF type:complete len:400 (+),score=69.98 TRINITY_DN7920_c0_g1_i2:151-1350(+)